MNLAFVVNNYPPRTGGVELHVQALAHELVRKGHRVTVVTLGPDLGWRDDAGVAVLTLAERFRVADILGFPRLGTRRRLTRLLQERGVAAVSVHTRFFPMSYVGWRAARAAGVPLIHTEHGSDHVASDSLLVRVASKLVDLTLGRLVLRGADRVLGVSEAVVAFVQRLSGVDAQVFYNAIAVAPRPPVVRQRPQHLVFVGRVVPGKGWEDYLTTVLQLRDAGHPVTGAVLGDGVDLPELRARVHALDLDSLVQVRGRVSQAEVRAELRGATLVNPTTLSEGFQTTLLEAIAERGSVATYPVPGAQTLMEQGAPVRIARTRTPAALTQVVEQLLQNPPAPASADFIDDWTWPARAEQYLSICRAALSADGQGRI